MSEDDKVVPIKKPVGELEYICEIGGSFDETRAILYVYSENLDKDEVSSLLGVSPTKAWNPNEPHFVGKSKSRKITKPFGKWWIESKRDYSEVVPKIESLLNQCTKDMEIWRTLTEKYECWMCIVGHLNNWNRELNLPVSLLQMLSERNLDLNVDVYFDGEELE